MGWGGSAASNMRAFLHWCWTFEGNRPLPFHFEWSPSLAWGQTAARRICRSHRSGRSCLAPAGFTWALHQHPCCQHPEAGRSQSTAQRLSYGFQSKELDFDYYFEITLTEQYKSSWPNFSLISMKTDPNFWANSVLLETLIFWSWNPQNWDKEVAWFCPFP